MVRRGKLEDQEGVEDSRSLIEATARILGGWGKGAGILS